MPKRRWFPIVLLVLAVVAWLVSQQALFNDGDTSWHLAAGKWMLENRAIPQHDPFSFTFRGQPWVAHEWFAEVAMAAVHGAAGWAGLAMLYALCLAGLLLIVARELLRSVPTRYAVLILSLLLLAVAPFVLARPHLMAWPLLAGWLVVLLRARERNDAPRLQWVLLMLVWANVHASFIFGLALAGLFALEALLADSDRRRVVIGWGRFGAAALLAACLTPHGPEGLLFPFQVARMEALPLIQEWRPTRLPEDLKFVLFAGAILAALLVRWRELTILRLLVIAGLAWLAIAHARHQALFAIVSILVLAATFEPQDREEDFDRISLRLLAAGLAVIALVRLAVPMQKADSEIDPATAISRIPAALRQQPVFNTYAFGGPLILSGIAPFIDGRADMYGDDFLFDYQAAVDGDAREFDRIQRRWDIRWTILDPKSRLVMLLDRDGGWRRIYSDRWAVIHVRT